MKHVCLLYSYFPEKMVPALSFEHVTLLLFGNKCQALVINVIINRLLSRTITCSLIFPFENCNLLAMAHAFFKNADLAHRDRPYFFPVYRARTGPDYHTL